MSNETEAMVITVCMGSSCFSRGNNRNLEVVRQYLVDCTEAIEVKLTGHLCENQCRNGPHLLIDGRAYQQVDAASVRALLDHHVALRRKAL